MTDVDRSDEYREWLAEDERRDAAIGGNGWHPDGLTETTDDAEKPNTNTWAPIDLGPYLRGEIEPPEPPNIGIHRSDGIHLIYAGREHVIVGDTESGKTWLALGCVAVELTAGRRVVYIHYEEPDPSSTIERLRLLGVPDDDLLPPLFRFLAPDQAAHKEWIAALADTRPALVVHDGVNEAMALHGAEIKDVDGASAFRRRLVTPFLSVGAATLACDHLPMGADGARVNAYGTVHKGNALNGARIQLENFEPFGRGLRGCSNVFVTKDRPGHLRACGKPTKTPGKTRFGVLAGDASDPFKPFALSLYAPRDNDKPADGGPGSALADTVYDVIAALDDQTVPTMDLLYAEMRKAGHPARHTDVRDAVADLSVEEPPRLVPVSGKRGAKGYRAVLTPSQESSDRDPSDPVRDVVPDPVPPKGGDGGTGSG